MATTERRPRKDQQRNRRALLEAAGEVFGEQGIGAPLDAIARRAGVSNSTLYRHFPTRRDLIVVVLLDSLQRNADELDRALRSPTAWSGLQQYLEWLFAEQVRNPTHLGAMRAVPAGENADVDGLRDRAHADLQRLMTQAQREGSLRPDRWIEDLYILLLLNESFVHARLESPGAASRRFLDLAVDALAARSPARPEDAGKEPVSIAILRSTLGRELAGLPVPAAAGGRVPGELRK
jgi:AcrR family transcriptional regulator